MKFLVVGAGAVGGVIAARLAANHDVTVVARGAHLEAIRTRGLTVHAPSGTEVVKLAAIADAGPGGAVTKPVVDGHVILLAVKTQDVAGALRTIDAPSDTPIVCMTNGLDAERQASRWFTHVYGMCVYTPSAYLEPGVVESWGTPVAGMYDIGRYPDGTDDTAAAIAAAFEGSRTWSRVYPDVMRWKRGKLLFNLSNALDAMCGPAARKHPLVEAMRAEARAVYAAAKLSTTTVEEETARQAGYANGMIDGRTRTGGSTWQSVARGAHTLECEYLNGEIAMLGRLHGVPTPANNRVLRAVTRFAAAGAAPGSLDPRELG